MYERRTFAAARKLPAALLVTGALILSGCAGSRPPASGISDPYEQVNRQVHAFNKGVDRVVYRPVSTAYGVVVPQPVRQGVNNVSRNLGEPQNAVNRLLQGDVENTVVHVLRFVMNSTIGFVGVFDPATYVGLPEKETDFGETLHVWGVGEGAYVAMPFLGPSTGRDTLGDFVDFFTDPFAPFLTYPEAVVPTASWLLENADYRYEFGGSIDQVLYESADSYAQSRLIYLEARRFELGQAGSGAYVDPYGDDPYDSVDGGDNAAAVPPASSGYIDPYEELYAE